MKTVIKRFRAPLEWWEALSAQVPNVSEYIRRAVNEQIKRDGLQELPGEIGKVGARHDYETRKNDTP